MSKLILFDFECAKHGRFEDLAKPDVRQVPCPKCGRDAQRQISPVRIDRLRIATTAGASPESIAYFDRVHRQQKAIEDRKYDEHGDYGHRPGAD